MCSFRVLSKPPDRLLKKGSPRSTFLVGKRVHKLGLLGIRRHYFRGSSAGGGDDSFGNSAVNRTQYRDYAIMAPLSETRNIKIKCTKLACARICWNNIHRHFVTMPFVFLLHVFCARVFVRSLQYFAHSPLLHPT
jgi:hypothetical protein